MENPFNNVNSPFTAYGYFRDEMEIIVNENLNNKYARFTVKLDFALLIRKNDILFFNEPGKEKPAWILSAVENYELLEDGAIKITERIIHPDRIQFYASFA